jgi:hypothetical protein
VGSIELSINREKDCTLLTAKGEISAYDIYNAVHQSLTGHATGKYLLDFTAADGSGISGDSFRELHIKISMLPDMSEDRKIAVVVSRNVGYGLARLSKSYFEISGIQGDYRIFRKLDEAVKWLK